MQCCSPKVNGGNGWGFFNALLGWTNSATYGSVISYNLYWLFVISAFFVLRFKEVKGHWPFMKPKNVALPEAQPKQVVDEGNSGGSVASGKAAVTTNVGEK